MHPQRGTKSDAVSVVIRIEFGKATNDSGELAAPGEGPKSISHAAAFEIAVGNAEGIEHVGNYPVVVRVFESSRSDKKKKDAVLTELGWARVDLLPLLQGTQSFDVSVPLHTVVALVEGEGGNVPVVLNLNLSTSVPMQTEEQLRTCNLLTLTVDGVFSLPDAWAPSPAGQPPSASYSISFPFAESASQDRIISLSDGIATAAATAPKLSSTIPREDEKGALKGKDDAPIRKDAEENRPRIVWPTPSVRIFMTPDAIDRAQKVIAANRTLPVELKRTVIATAKVCGDQQLSLPSISHRIPDQ